MKKLIINKDEIFKNIGIGFRDETDYIDYLKLVVYSLSINNKNYTTTQKRQIQELKEILDNMEVFW